MGFQSLWPASKRSMNGTWRPPAKSCIVALAPPCVDDIGDLRQRRHLLVADDGAERRRAAMEDAYGLGLDEAGAALGALAVEVEDGLRRDGAFQPAGDGEQRRADEPVLEPHGPDVDGVGCLRHCGFLLGRPSRRPGKGCVWG